MKTMKTMTFVGVELAIGVIAIRKRLMRDLQNPTHARILAVMMWDENC